MEDSILQKPKSLVRTPNRIRPVYNVLNNCLQLDLKLFVVVVARELPETFKLERQQAQLMKMIDAQMNPIEGMASTWDYEKNDWKKQIHAGVSTLKFC